jgi:hypothetical protein
MLDPFFNILLQVDVSLEAHTWIVFLAVYWFIVLKKGSDKAYEVRNDQNGFQNTTCSRIKTWLVRHSHNLGDIVIRDTFIKFVPKSFNLFLEAFQFPLEE